MIKIEAQEVREAGPPVLLHEVHANGASAVSSEAKTAALRMKRGGFPVMMQKIQLFGGAMYTPAILFAFSGIVVGLGTLFTTEAIFGEMATAGHLWFDCWNVLLQGGWTLFNQMPLLFS